MKKIRNLVLEKIDNESASILAENLAEYINSASSEVKDEQMEGFVDITNLFLFEHGILENTGLKDYVLIDFLKNNSFLVSDIKLPTTIFESSILELGIADDLSLTNLEANQYFDIYKEFVAINAISRSNPELCRLVVEKIGPSLLDRKFLRILSYYSALYCLHLRIDIENEKNDFTKEILNEKLNHMFNIYEDFTSISPSWLNK